MTTPIEISDDTKSRLEVLQAQIRLRTGQCVTQQELLTQLISEARESPSEIINSFRESTVPLSTDEREAMQQGRFRSGMDTDEEYVDEALYR